MPAALLPGLLPPPEAGFDAAARRVVLAGILAFVLSTSLLYLISSAPGLEAPLLAAWLSVLLAAAVPWHRLPRDAFGVIGVAMVAVAGFFVYLTGGERSPYAAVFGFAVLGGCAGVSRTTGTLLGALGAVGLLLPFAYARPDAGQADRLFLLVALVLFIGFFVPWLTQQARRVPPGVALALDQIGQERRMSAELSAREEYMSVLAHELRNPVVGIGAAARVLARELEGRPTHGKATAIGMEASHILEMLDGLTDVSSIEAGRLRSALNPTDIRALVRETIESMHVPDHNIVLRDAEVPMIVLGDERRLRQVVRNLVGNAAKYSPAGTQVEVTIGLSADREYAIVQVRDHGPGIPPLERGRLFQRFARLSTAGGTRGSGLGLYICQGIIQDHHGEIWVDWPPGGGSAFSVSLPLLEEARVVPSAWPMGQHGH